MTRLTSRHEHAGFGPPELQRLLDSSPDVHYIADASEDHAISFVSAGIARQTGYQPSQFTESPEFWATRIHPEDRSRVIADLEQVREGGRYVHEYRFRFADGEWHRIRDEFCLLRDESRGSQQIVGTWVHTDGRHNAETLRSLENIVVALVASDTPLQRVLDMVNEGIEARFPEMLCSVLLLDDEGVHLRHASAPSLPAEYNRAIDGITIGPDVGSCGTAAYLNKQVIVSDIAADPLWRNYRDLALEHGLRACWSTPIEGSGNSIIGTFAIFYRTPRRPTAGELDMVRRMTSLVTIAIEHRRAQAEARENRTRLEAFLDHSPDLAFIKDTGGRFLLVNKAFERLLGIEADAVLDKTIRDLYPQPEADRIFMLEQKVVRDKRVVVDQCTLSRPDKEYVFETTKFPILDPAGQVIAIGGLDHDITKLKRTEEALRENERRLQLVTDHLPILIAYVDRQCRYVFCNVTCKSWYARPSADIIGKTVAEVLGDESFRKLEPYIRSALDGNRQVFDERISYPNGPTRDVHVVYIPHVAEDGGVVGFYAMVLDISARKKTEEEVMRNARENMEMRVEIRTAELERTNERLLIEIRQRKRTEAHLKAAMAKLQAADRAKSRFLANMNHELRTPLHAVLGYSELLKEDGEAGESVRSDAGRIHASATRLLSLIDDVLEISGTETGETRVEPRRFDVSEMVHSVAAAALPLVEKNANTLVVRCAEAIGDLYADEVKVRKCLLSLLDNAAKFTEQGEIELSVIRETLDEREWITFRVKDTGTGIPSGRKETVFEPFAHGDESIARKHGGPGLGLAMVSRYCERMGGAVEVDSLPGKGATFTLRLPFDPDDQAIPV